MGLWTSSRKNVFPRPSLHSAAVLFSHLKKQRKRLHVKITTQADMSTERLTLPRLPNSFTGSTGTADGGRVACTIGFLRVREHVGKPYQGRRQNQRQLRNLKSQKLQLQDRILAVHAYPDPYKTSCKAPVYPFPVTPLTTPM